jgi:nucleoside-diphosphate-sugar epimerase
VRVFVVGATGAVGRRLVSQLAEAGHEVVGTSRSFEGASRLRGYGATPVALDVLDRDAVRRAVEATRPDAIVHEATALTGLQDFKHFDRSFEQTNRLRTEGTDNLLAAARENGVDRFVAQSFASNRYIREGGPVKTEDDALDPDLPDAMRESQAAMIHLEQASVEAGGIALRYGGFYGDPEDALLEAVRKRQFPVVGDGEGIASFIHLDDAATGTVLAVERGAPGIYNIVDDEPAPLREWLPELARIVGAGPPRHFPTWLARIVAGEVPVMMATDARGASNAKAKRELGWTLRYPSWREGFRASYAPLAKVA